MTLYELIDAMMEKKIVFWEHRSFYIIYIGHAELKYQTRLGTGFVPAYYYNELILKHKVSAFDDAPKDFCNVGTCEYDNWIEKYKYELKRIAAK